MAFILQTQIIRAITKVLWVITYLVSFSDIILNINDIGIWGNNRATVSSIAYKKKRFFSLLNSHIIITHSYIRVAYVACDLSRYICSLLYPLVGRKQSACDIRVSRNTLRDICTGKKFVLTYIYVRNIYVY